MYTLSSVRTLLLVAALSFVLLCATALNTEGGVKQTTFIVLFVGGQGSSWLIERLSNLNDICVMGFEPIDGKVISRNETLRWESITHMLRPKEQNPSLDSFSRWKDELPYTAKKDNFLTRCKGNETAFGYKARMRPMEAQRMLNDPFFDSVHFFLLKRNVVKQVAAEYRRMKCGISQFRMPKRNETALLAFRKKKCEVDVKAFLRSMHTYDRNAARHDSYIFNKKYSHRVSVITYEEMQTDIDGIIKEKFGSVFGISMESRDKQRHAFPAKASPELLCDSISNYNELCAGIAEKEHNKRFVQMMNVDSCGENSTTASHIDNTLASSSSTILKGKNGCCTFCKPPAPF